MAKSTQLLSRLLVRSGFAAKCLKQRQSGPDPVLTILAYHRIGDRADRSSGLDSQIISASPAAFDWQLDYLQRNFSVLPFEAVLDCARQGKPLPPNTAVITFDDGYRDNFDLAFPILQRRGLPATIYLITGLIGTERAMWWDDVAYLLQSSTAKSVLVPGIGSMKLATIQDRLHAREALRRYFKTLPANQHDDVLDQLRRKLFSSAEPASRPRAFMTWDEVKEMQQNCISFGAHTHTHSILSHVSIEQAEREIDESKSIVAYQTGQPVRLFAYPNGRQGDFNDQTRALVCQQGIEAAVTLMHGSNAPSQPGFDWLSLRRIYIGSDDRDMFIAKVSGALEKFIHFARPMAGRQS